VVVVVNIPKNNDNSKVTAFEKLEQKCEIMFKKGFDIITTATTTTTTIIIIIIIIIIEK